MTRLEGRADSELEEELELVELRLARLKRRGLKLVHERALIENELSQRVGEHGRLLVGQRALKRYL